MAEGLRRIAPGRFLLFLLLLGLAAPAGVATLGWRHGLLAGFDLAAFAFLASLAPLLRQGGAAAMRARSARNDGNRLTLLALTGIVSLAVLAAIAAELGDKAAPSAGAVALVIGTLVLAWAFSNAVFTLHYAHVFYLGDGRGGDRGGLDFPHCEEPDYWDFAYFAFTLSMTFQTSDVSVTARGLRQVALFHSLAAFVFNIGVLAFTVNVLGG